MTINIKRAVNVTATGRHIHGACKPVYCITDGTIYASVTDVAEKIGAHITEVSKMVRGKQKTLRGKKYCFLANVMDHIGEISENIQTLNEKAAIYDAMIAEQNAKKEAAENLAKHKAKRDKLLAELEKEEQLVKEAEELCNA